MGICVFWVMPDGAGTTYSAMIEEVRHPPPLLPDFSFLSGLLFFHFCETWCGI